MTAFIAACLGYRIEGVLDFSLIGILAKISTCLAENGIGILAISTFNTDYILTKAENFEKAVKTLEAKGYKYAESRERKSGAQSSWRMKEFTDEKNISFWEINREGETIKI